MRQDCVDALPRSRNYELANLLAASLQAASSFNLSLRGFKAAAAICTFRGRRAVRALASMPGSAADVTVVDGVDKRRCRKLNKVPMNEGPGDVIYWMSRDQRWLLSVAKTIGRCFMLRSSQFKGQLVFMTFWRIFQQNITPVPVFVKDVSLPGGLFLRFDFLLKGLKEVAEALRSKNIPFHLKLGKEPLKKFLRLLTS
eukprot:g27770.t1